jgi:CRISPR-associated protein Csm5
MAGGRMNYRLTCLTPTLVGDGQRLSPIDYMVWKDHVNVLDQWRIFRLLAKGPRLEGYLSQLKKAEKLDFASWGGFAQNYAGRRIPFEHASSTQYWERTHAEHLFIPTFSTGPSGPYLPGTAIKGAFRTGVVHGRVTERLLTDLAERASIRKAECRGVRRSRSKSPRWEPPAPIRCASSPLTIRRRYRPVTFKVYLLRTSTLEARGAGKFEVAWKQTPRGNVKRAEDSTPVFAEMAEPGASSKASGIRTRFSRSLKSARRCDAARR